MLVHIIKQKKLITYFSSTIKVNEHYFKKHGAYVYGQMKIQLIISTIIDGKIYKNSCRFITVYCIPRKET